MPSFQTQIEPRRQMFLSLSGQIEGQLRDAYDCRFRAGEETQASLASKLGVNRSVVHRRLMGHTNMTIETIADMLWALGYAIDLKIYDPVNNPACNYFAELPRRVESAPANLSTVPVAGRNADNPLLDLAKDILQGKQTTRVRIAA